MTEAKISVTFTQKISEQAYETSDYSLTVERTVPDANVVEETQALFEMAKSEVLKQAGQEFDVSDTGVVMRKLKSAVPKPTSNAPSAPAKAPAPSQQEGPTQRSVTAPPARPSGGTMTGRVYKRLPQCVGKNAEINQAAFNILAFQPATWSDNGGDIKVYEVKEKADGSTDVAKSGNNFPNFSISPEALAILGFDINKNHGIWIREGDSNVPLTVWDAVGGQTEADAVEWDWLARRAELQQYAYKPRG
tara:strand:+ start:15175 stop:15918 length:744 start_codon:yes stop_codon:yes gene_type:complete